jgi:Na+/melibiose symporter-like transporter
VQSASALNGIVMTMSIYPASTFALCIVCLFFYRINKQAEIQITTELTERRKGFAALPA